MARINRLPLAMAVFSAVMASQAQALGLGDITLRSALNQPLDAEIALLQVGDLTSEELVAHLANAATFDRLGVDRPTFLQNLRFTPVIRGGRSYIHVVSTQAVREPYLNFLVEVERPNGSLMREYTLLLDPPGYSETRSYGSYADTRPERADSYASNARPISHDAAPRKASKPAVAATPGDGRYTTVSGDSLWSISGRLAGQGVSRHTYMAQLQQLNPQAFVGGNPHRLRIGQTLVLPASTTAGAAGTPPVASAAPVAPNAPAAPAVAAATQQQVDQAQSQLANMNAERDKLNQRMDDLQKQLNTLQQTLESRDQQVQSLEAQLAQRQAAAASAQPAPAPVAPKPAPAVAAPAPSAPQDEGLVRYWPWAAALGAALLLGVLYGRRRKPEATEPPRVQAAAASLPPQPPVRPAPVAKPVSAPVAAPVAPAASDASLAKLPTASSDSLEGANIYIAYGRFGQARDMLLKAIVAEPERRELRMKLLLVLAELGEVGAFHEQEKALVAMGGDQKQIDQLKTRYPAMLERDESVAISDTLGEWEGLELDEIVAEPVQEEQPMLGDSELNLGDLPMDLDWSALDPFETPKTASTKAKAAAEPVLEDFRSNLRELPEVTEFDLDGEHAGAFGLPSRPVVSGEQDKLLASLDEARACIDRGDLEQAYRILKRVLEDGDSHQREEARELLARIA
ncbi:FimV/HubP family polar landmark protein [Pseudomonas sp. QL9]|uniref:FimV/HubP family polar landmark protein n=1 Tax=Pseudomonas sp. QL9 TaxID=3242725 RepID=UPI003529D4AF